MSDRVLYSKTRTTSTYLFKYLHTKHTQTPIYYKLNRPFSLTYDEKRRNRWVATTNKVNTLATTMQKKKRLRKRETCDEGKMGRRDKGGVKSTIRLGVHRTFLLFSVILAVAIVCCFAFAIVLMWWWINILLLCWLCVCAFVVCIVWKVQTQFNTGLSDRDRLGGWVR